RRGPELGGEAGRARKDRKKSPLKYHLSTHFLNFVQSVYGRDGRKFKNLCYTKYKTNGRCIAGEGGLQMDTAAKGCRGLVLAGGGARGSYQVGVWRALDELGWTAGAVTGTSVGCLNGAMYVLGQYETARDMWLTICCDDDIDLPYSYQVTRAQVYADRHILHAGS